MDQSVILLMLIAPVFTSIFTIHLNLGLYLDFDGFFTFTQTKSYTRTNQE